MKLRRKAAESLGLFVLGLLLAWFLHDSWRKWPDPIIDSGPQWYATWRVSLGAVPYRDFMWNYGPLSLLFNGLLFKCFGPGMMVLAAANLVVYAGIVALAYLAFRMAWGPLAAFVAVAVFISVFSFSLLNAVGNYNYVLPYANEATHGILLMLVTVFVMVRWCGGPSRLAAFCMGLCGGVAAVLKPEFMLAWVVLCAVSVWLRCRQRQWPDLVETGVLLAGGALPTLAITAWFLRVQPWKAALLDATHAWSVLVNTNETSLPAQSSYMGFNHAGQNLVWELQFAMAVALVIGLIWAAGWFVNRLWSRPLRWAMALGAGVLACCVNLGGGFEIGPCLPGLIVIVLVVVLSRVESELRQNRRVAGSNLMALALVLLAAAMLTRMALRARINHFGFIQAAFAGMVVAAFTVSEVPRWTGHGRWGRRVTQAGILTLLIVACGGVAAESARNHASQIQPVGSGVDRFYAFGPTLDETGQLVNWCLERLQSVPTQATLLVLPEGVMINYLTRHERPMPELSQDEGEYIKQLGRVRPDYVIIIWGDQRDGGILQFGDPGQPGEKIEQWLRENYFIQDTHRGHSKWAFILRRKN